MSFRFFTPPIVAALGLALALAVTGCEAILPALRIAATAFSNYDPKYERYANLVGDLATAIESTPIVPKPNETSPAPRRIALDVELLLQVDQDGFVVEEPIENGAELHYRGSPDTSDRFRVRFTPSEDAYVYVFDIDSTGWVVPVHPRPGHDGGPVGAGMTVGLPDGDRAWAVDEHVGVETLYFVASAERRDDLEELARRFAELERPALDAPATVDTVGDGIGSIQHDAVVTRWFWHR